MVTLEDVYGNADLDLIMLMHPTWDFYRNEHGFLCCRIKQTKREAGDSRRRQTSPQK
jgi:hypothetical protein